MSRAKVVRIGMCLAPANLRHKACHLQIGDRAVPAFYEPRGLDTGPLKLFSLLPVATGGIVGQRGVVLEIVVHQHQRAVRISRSAHPDFARLSTDITDRAQHYRCSNPRFRASTTAWVRSVTRRRIRIIVICDLTVASLIWSSSPISRLLFPATISLNTSRSR